MWVTTHAGEMKGVGNGHAQIQLLNGCILNNEDGCNICTERAICENRYQIVSLPKEGKEYVGMRRKTSIAVLK
jgi:hypothetical protein